MDIPNYVSNLRVKEVETSSERADAMPPPVSFSLRNADARTAAAAAAAAALLV